jgi:hypothetical protein
VNSKAKPQTLLYYNEEAAVGFFDALIESYPNDEISLITVTEETIKTRKGTKDPLPPAICPRGHSGIANGMELVKRTNTGRIFCSVCGYMGN